MKFCDKRIQKHLLSGGKIKRVDSDCIIYLNDNCELYCESSYPSSYFLVKKDLTVNTWEIVESEYNWDKIIEDKVLCEFWDDFEDKENPTVGCLTKKTAEGFYKSECAFSWKHCKPFNPADFNIAKKLKEY